MDVAVIFDCEFLICDGAPRRFWCGPHDPDPVIAQIGAVKISLQDGFTIQETKRTFVKPFDRDGNAYELDPLFIKLTGISDEIIADEGVMLGDALQDLDDFAAGAKFWSWGKDEFNLIAISCYVANIAPVISATRFGNACKLLLEAGMPYADMQKTRSNMLADYYGIKHPPLNAHDALDDALSVAYVLQHLMQEGMLDRKFLMPC